MIADCKSELLELATAIRSVAASHDTQLILRRLDTLEQRLFQALDAHIANLAPLTAQLKSANDALAKTISENKSK
jgi:hypothetical protein